MTTANQTIEALRNALEEKGISVKPAQSVDALELSSPWFVKLLSIGAGWLAAVFMSGIFALLFYGLLADVVALLVFGIAIISLAWFSFSGTPSDFRQHLALAISLVGQFLITYVVFLLTSHNFRLEPSSLFILLFFHLGLLVVMPNTLHRYLSAIAASGCLGLLFSSLGWHPVYPAVALALIALLTLNEFKSWFSGKVLMPLVYGFALQFVFPVAYGSLLSEVMENKATHAIWLLDLAMILPLLAIVLLLVWRYKASKSVSLIAAMAAIVIGLLSIELNGIAAGCAILLLGCSHSNRALIAIAALSLLTQTSFYYYNLDTTLLVKSASLAGLGIALLVMRWGMLAKFKRSSVHTMELSHE